MALRALAALSVLAVLATPAVAQQAVPPSVRPSQHVVAGGNPPPSDTLRNPLTADSATVAEGAKLFDGFNCSGCHAGAGPALLDGRWKYGGTDAEIFLTIFYGRARGMPAYGGAIPAESIWRIVTWLRAQQPARDTLSTTSW